jgi:hypothetical protein
MNLNFHFPAASNDVKLEKILNRITHVEDIIMATLEENIQFVKETAEAVKANSDLIASVTETTTKIFDEVQRLVAAANAEVPGLSELRDAVLAQQSALIAANAQSTAVDGLIPDLVVDPAV